MESWILDWAGVWVWEFLERKGRDGKGWSSVRKARNKDIAVDMYVISVTRHLNIYIIIVANHSCIPVALTAGRPPTFVPSPL
jgi:hypothetical protein